MGDRSRPTALRRDESARWIEFQELLRRIEFDRRSSSISPPSVSKLIPSCLIAAMSSMSRLKPARLSIPPSPYFPIAYRASSLPTTFSKSDCDTNPILL